MNGAKENRENKLPKARTAFFIVIFDILNGFLDWTP